MIQENRLSNHSHLLPPYNNYGSQPNFDYGGKIAKGHLFRQGSMNEVLKPYSGINERDNIMGRNGSMHEMVGRNIQPHENAARSKV